MASGRRRHAVLFGSTFAEHSTAGTFSPLLSCPQAVAAHSNATASGAAHRQPPYRLVPSPCHLTVSLPHPATISSLPCSMLLTLLRPSHPLPAAPCPLLLPVSHPLARNHRWQFLHVFYRIRGEQRGGTTPGMPTCACAMHVRHSRFPSQRDCRAAVSLSFSFIVHPVYRGRYWRALRGSIRVCI
jgi:hypothetical protein